jgi:hypothetical protein
LNREFVTTTLILIGIAVGVGVLIYGLVYAGGSRGTKRYRPGRPFVFTPVWFLSAPQRQARAGISGGRELEQASPAVPARPARPRETGGASDRW